MTIASLAVPCACSAPDTDVLTPRDLKAAVAELQALGYGLWVIRNLIVPDLARAGTAQCSGYIREEHRDLVEKTLPGNAKRWAFDTETDLVNYSIGPNPNPESHYS